MENAIYDPATTRTVTGTDGRQYVVRDPFLNNVIPQNRFDPIAAKIQAMIPRPTRAGNVNNWEQVFRSDKIQNVPSIKIDHMLRDTAKLSFYAGGFSTDQYVNPDGLPEPLTQLRILKIRSQTYRFNYDHTLTPTLLFHFGGGFIKYRNPETGVPGSVDFDSAGVLGLVGTAVTPSGFPRLTGLNSNQGGSNLSLGPSHAGLYVNDKPTLLASATWVKGESYDQRRRGMENRYLLECETTARVRKFLVQCRADGSTFRGATAVTGRRQCRVSLCELSTRSGRRGACR
jgi:hypothetical protein